MYAHADMNVAQQHEEEDSVIDCDAFYRRILVLNTNSVFSNFSDDMKLCYDDITMWILHICHDKHLCNLFGS